MILVTTGTNEQPFDRLVRAAAALGNEEPLVVQHGSSRVPHGLGRWVDFMSFDDLADLMREARIVVCHAGVGSVMLARRCGRRPVVLPRRLCLGEAVDDHQVGLARRMDAAGVVHLVEDERRLAQVVANVDGACGAHSDAGLSGGEALAADVHAYLRTLALPAVGLRVSGTLGPDAVIRVANPDDATAELAEMLPAAGAEPPAGA